MKNLNWFVVVFLVAVACHDSSSGDGDGCSRHKTTSDDVQQRQQEQILEEGTATVGMPAIKNFRERKLAKDILEMRDQEDFVTYTYLQSSMTGKLTFLGESIGFGLPYTTQFTNPMKIVRAEDNLGYAILPQADPNGLFSANTDGTWVLMKDPNGTDVKPVYIEPRIVVSPFKLPVDSDGTVVAP